MTARAGRGAWAALRGTRVPSSPSPLHPLLLLLLHLLLPLKMPFSCPLVPEIPLSTPPWGTGCTGLALGLSVPLCKWKQERGPSGSKENSGVSPTLSKYGSSSYSDPRGQRWGETQLWAGPSCPSPHRAVVCREEPQDTGLGQVSMGACPLPCLEGPLQATHRPEQPGLDEKVVFLSERPSGGEAAQGHTQQVGSLNP